jgi:hypothetical protein
MCTTESLPRFLTLSARREKMNEHLEYYRIPSHSLNTCEHSPEIGGQRAAKVAVLLTCLIEYIHQESASFSRHESHPSRLHHVNLARGMLLATRYRNLQ